MATLLLCGITSTIGSLLARSRWQSVSASHLGVLRLLKWQADLVALTLFFGLAQQSAMRGDFEMAGWFGGLAISELAMAVFHYTADA